MAATVDFDAFYLDARSRLLLQTYALTGDLPAARAAVRDAFVVAWHHWRKVSAVDPEAYVRPIAWSHAQRRHTARVWHRERHLDPEAKATLDALGRLTGPQRTVLLLTTLSSGSLADIAREAGLTPERAADALQHGTATYARHREIEPARVRASFEPLRAQVAAVRLPRAPVVRRAGTARRRSHTLVGVVAACAALVVSGGVAATGGDVRPALAQDQPAPSGPARPSPEAVVEVALSADDLLSTSQVGRVARDATWSERTSENERGDGLLVPCQQERYADPDGEAALARVFTADRARDRPAASAVQLTELARNPRRAEATYDATVRWYAACAEARVQLLSTHAVAGVGDEARLVVLRSWKRPVRTVTVGVVRSGLVTSTTMTSIAGTAAPVRRTSATLLAAATNALCGRPGTESCAGPPRLRDVAPEPVGEVPGMLSELDLPGVSSVPKPWVGTRPREAQVNYAASGCARGSFALDSMSHRFTRSFVIPGTRLPAEFGMTETVATLPVPAARTWTAAIRERLVDCASEDLGTSMTRVLQRLGPDREISVYDITTELSDARSVRYRMALLRSGTAVAQLGFIPAPAATLRPADFAAIAERALERLARMPEPSAPGKNKR